MSAYLDSLKATLPGVIATLERKGIEARHLEFGGEGKPPAKKITVPTDARSEFLANRAMGDWAETRFRGAVRRGLFAGCGVGEASLIAFGVAAAISINGRPSMSAAIRSMVRRRWSSGSASSSMSRDVSCSACSIVCDGNSAVTMQ